MPRTGLQWAISLDRSPMRQHDDLARAQDADLRQSIAAVALEPQIRRGASADLRCYNRKTKDRCPTPTRGLWFSNPSGAAHHLPDLPEGRSFSCADSNRSLPHRLRSQSTTVPARLSHCSGRGTPSRGKPLTARLMRPLPRGVRGDSSRAVEFISTSIRSI